MKEFVEKLIGRLEEEKNIIRNNYFLCRGKPAVLNDRMRRIEDSIKIVNQLAEEYNNEVCEWKITFNKDIHREYKPLCSEDGFIDMTGYFDYKYCPYCGKKIKVVE